MAQRLESKKATLTGIHCHISSLLRWQHNSTVVEQLWTKGHLPYVFLSFQLLLPLKTQEDLDQAVTTLGCSSGANGLLRILLKTPKNNHVSSQQGALKDLITGESFRQSYSEVFMNIHCNHNNHVENSSSLVTSRHFMGNWWNLYF